MYVLYLLHETFWKFRKQDKEKRKKIFFEGKFPFNFQKDSVTKLNSKVKKWNINNKLTLHNNFVTKW